MIAIGRSRLLYDSILKLVDSGYSIHAIITSHAYDEYDIKEQDFEKLAIKLGAEYFLSSNINLEKLRGIVSQHNIRFAISANWKYTLSGDILNLFPDGILNVHLGNLPDYKGNATVNWSIINQLDHIYCNIHRMDMALDEGDVIARQAIPISSTTYISEVNDIANFIAPQLFLEAVKKISLDPTYVLVPGSPQGIRCFPRRPEDSRIDWNADASSICALVRASSRPYSGAFCFLGSKKLTIWKGNISHFPTPFIASPGSVIHLDNVNKIASIACQYGSQMVLEVNDAEIEHSTLSFAEIFNSIRLRLT